MNTVMNNSMNLGAWTPMGMRQLCASRVVIRPDLSGPERSDFGSTKPNPASICGQSPIYDIFEGTAEIQQLVISRVISGMHIQ